MIKCPKCSKSFPVPEDDEPLKVEPEPVKKESPNLLLESSAPKTTLVKRRKATLPPDDEEASDGGEKPRRISKKRRKRQKQTSSNTPLIVGLVIGGVLLIGAGVAFMAWKSSANKNAPVAQNNPSPPGPGMAATDAGRPRPPRGPRPEMAPPEPDSPKPQAGPAPSAPTRVRGRVGPIQQWSGHIRGAVYTLPSERRRWQWSRPGQRRPGAGPLQSRSETLRRLAGGPHP